MTNLDKFLINYLKDPINASDYINEIIEDSELSPENESRTLLLNTLNNVVQANGGVDKISEISGIPQSSLYKILKDGNPKLENLISLLNSLGLKISVKPKNIEVA